MKKKKRFIIISFLQDNLALYRHVQMKALWQRTRSRRTPTCENYACEHNFFVAKSHNIKINQPQMITSKKKATYLPHLQKDFVTEAHNVGRLELDASLVDERAARTNARRRVKRNVDIDKELHQRLGVPVLARRHKRLQELLQLRRCNWCRIRRRRRRRRRRRKKRARRWRWFWQRRLATKLVCKAHKIGVLLQHMKCRLVVGSRCRR